MGLPMQKYRILVRYSAEKDAHVATAPEIEGCEGEGAPRSEALENLERELSAQLENMKERGVEPPEPMEELDFDGKLSVTVTPALHRDLVFRARSSNVELEKLLVELLARGVAGRTSGGRPRHQGEGRGGRRGGPQGQRYHDIMENKADFMEYVRSLENSGGGRGGGQRGGGGGGRRR